VRDGIESPRFTAIWNEPRPNEGWPGAAQRSAERPTAVEQLRIMRIARLLTWSCTSWRTGRGIHLTAPLGRRDKTLFSNLIQVSKLTRYRKEWPVGAPVRLLPLTRVAVAERGLVAVAASVRLAPAADVMPNTPCPKAGLRPDWPLL